MSYYGIRSYRLPYQTDLTNAQKAEPQNLSPTAQHYQATFKQGISSYSTTPTINAGGNIFVPGNKNQQTYQQAITEYSNAQMELMDTNKDGTVSSDEYYNYELRLASNITNPQDQQSTMYNIFSNKANRFKSVDYNGDGKIDSTELLAHNILQDSTYTGGDTEYDCKLSGYDLFKMYSNPDRHRRIMNMVYEQTFGHGIAQDQK